MANHKSAIKRHKQSQKRNELNKAAKTKVRNVVKSVRAAIQSNDQAAAAAALVRANSTLDKIAGAGVIHWKKAARKISRLSRAVNGMQAQA